MNLLELFGPISTFVFEAEGVLCDEIFQLSESGERSYSVDSKDIYALQTAAANGYKIWLVASGNEKWLNGIHVPGIDIISRGSVHSQELLKAVLEQASGYEQVLYMGFDIPASTAMNLCGLPTCPANAVPEIKQLAKYISPFAGGKGCIRDVIEKVLKLNGHWQMPNGNTL